MSVFSPVRRTTARTPAFRPRALVAAILLALGTTSAFAADTPPSKPAGVSVKFYDGSGGVLFWQRSTDDRGVRGYEITLNGRNLGVRDVLSYYDASLRSGSRYDFTVAAVDTAGQRSPVASVSLGAVAPATPSTGTPSAPPSSATLAAPAGLRASVYSPSSAGIAWTRSSTPGLRYEVRRDGQLVTTTDGTSHVAAGLVGGRDYAFEIVALDRGGQRSAPATIMFDTRASGPVATPSAPSTPPTTTPSAPAGTVPAPSAGSIVIYSDTAVGLRWTPAPASARVMTTDVIRDGVSIGMANGNTYFDDQREANTAHVYQLVAIDAAGKRSAPTTVGNVEKAKLVSGAGSASANPDGLDRVALSGSTAIIGLTGSTPIDIGQSSPFYIGAAYVHERAANGSWRETQRLDASDLELQTESFGTALAFDGRTLVVGEPDLRRAHVYERDQSGKWARRQLLVRPGQDVGTYGLAVAIDGATMMVMANDKVSLPNDASGLGYTFVNSIDVFARTGSGVWQRVQRLDPSDLGSLGADDLGERMVLEGDTLMVRGLRGAIRFARGGDGRWSRKETLVPAASSGAAGPVDFRSSMALDGDTLALGSSNADAVAVFTRGSDGAWRESQRLKIGFRGGDTGVLVGSGYPSYTSVALADGRLYVGVSGDDGLTRRSGGVYVFERGANGQWVRTTERLLGSDATNGSRLGSAVAADGDLVLAVGYERGTPVGRQLAGGRPAAYVFEAQGD